MTRQLGDDAVLLDVEGGHKAAQELARSIRARDVIPAATTVGVIGPSERLERPEPPAPPSTHEIPVVFDGEDLDELGLARDELARLLDGVRLEVLGLGFMPGFAYLTGLPDELARLPRRSSPRPRVPAGSFAVAAGYAGIYPVASPGGWNLLGHSAVQLFDQERPPFALLQPGDHVLIVPRSTLGAAPSAVRHPLEGNGIEVLDPGPLLLIEDRGRDGVGSLGVPRAGAANSCWLRVANRALGNEEDAAALELAGPIRLRALRDLLVALAGDVDLFADGDVLPSRLVTAIAGGQEISTGPIRSGARALLAIAGGLLTPSSFASRSTDAVSGLLPGPLRKGDRLEVGAGSSRARLRFSLPANGTPARLRAIAGPDPVPASLFAGSFMVDPRSDRTGVRLRPLDDQPRAPQQAVPSHAVVPGAIQLPPAGTPIVLGPDCGPVGGYPVGATVITADLWRLGMLSPGDVVLIELVSLGEAEQARHQLERSLEESVSGWYPTAFA